jgi:hypothetical protein
MIKQTCTSLPLHDLDYINEVLNENPEEDSRQQQDEWEGGLTFIAKSSRKYNAFKLIAFSSPFSEPPHPKLSKTRLIVKSMTEII